MRRLLDEFLRLVDVYVGAVVRAAPAVAGELPVLVQRVVELRVGIAGRRADERIPAGRHVRRVARVGISVEVLADERGAVTAALQPCRDRRLLDTQSMRG